jgi:iron complex transport system substrate-binding protein
MRVVSLLPSATEIVYALDVEPVGTSHECDHPPEAADLPSVVESRVDADASSAEIDAQVQDAEASGGVYEIDREALAAADPDLVISQGICEVCAVDTVVVEDAIEELGLDCEVLTTDPHSVDDVLDDVRRIGAALDREAAADDLVADLRARIDRVADRAAEASFRPDVAVLDWLDPVMVAGH